MVLALAVVSLGVGLRCRWFEFTVVGTACLAALAVGVVAASLPRKVEVELRIRPRRTTAGSMVEAEVAARAGALPLANPVLVLAVAGEGTAIRFPFLLPRRSASEVVEVRAERRGVIAVGPVRYRTGDLLGLVGREKVVTPMQELLVHPRTIRVPSFVPGVIVDLEGVSSDHLSPQDMDFHTLREYVIGDDLRHVHWRSSAKLRGEQSASLLVRQYQETRRAAMAVLVDGQPGSYGSDEEFELAVSCAASMAVRAIRDDFEVLFGCGSRTFRCRSVQNALDAAARVGLAGDAPSLREVAVRAARTGPNVSAAAIVSGGAMELAALSTASSAYPPGVRRFALDVALGCDPGLSGSEELRLMKVGRLDDLPVLMRSIR